MLKVIGTRKSRAFRVLWLLEELGLDYEHDPSPPRSATVIEANPSGKVLALLVDGTAITDSTAILTYLTDAHGQFTHGPGTVERARQDALTCAILDEIDGTLWTAAKHSFVLPEAQRVPEVKPSAKWEYERAIARISEGFAGPFLIGKAMTVPDILLTHCLGWAKIAGFPDPSERLADYVREMMARPAFGRAAALP